MGFFQVPCEQKRGETINFELNKTRSPKHVVTYIFIEEFIIIITQLAHMMVEMRECNDNKYHLKQDKTKNIHINCIVFFSKILKYIPDSLVFPLVSVFVHTMTGQTSALQQNWQNCSSQHVNIVLQSY